VYIEVNPGMEYDNDKDRLLAREVDGFDPNQRGLFSLNGRWLNVTPIFDTGRCAATFQIDPPNMSGIFVVVIDRNRHAPDYRQRNTILLVCRAQDGNRFHSTVPSGPGKATDIACNDLFVLGTFSPDGGGVDEIFENLPGVSQYVQVGARNIIPENWRMAWNHTMKSPMQDISPLRNLAYRAGVMMVLGLGVSLSAPFSGKTTVPPAAKTAPTPKIAVNTPSVAIPGDPLSDDPYFFEDQQLEIKTHKVPLSVHTATIEMDARASQEISGLGNRWAIASGLMITKDELGNPVTLAGLINHLPDMKGEGWAVLLENQAAKMFESAATLQIMAQAARMGTAQPKRGKKK
jgi:hypothetical protein